MNKLLLIEPTLYNADGKGLIKHKVLFAPGVIFPLLAAMLPKNWEVETIYETVENIDFNANADLIGLNAMGHSIFRAMDIAQEFKKKGKVVFIGGYMASMNPDFVLKAFDSVVIGDAEISFPLLLNDFEKNGTLKKKYYNPVNDITGLPMPKYRLLLDKPIRKMLPVQAGRGCPHLCSFCSITSVYKGKFLHRKVDEVIREITEIRNLGFRRFLVVDDNLLSNTDFLDEFVTKLKPLRMKWSGQCTINLARNPALLKKVAESGCEVLSIGLESIIQSGLNDVNKQWVKVKENSRLINSLYQAGIAPKVQFMLGLDKDTIESIKDTYKFIMQNKIPIVRVYIMTPIPGTWLHRQYKENSRLIHDELIKYDSMNCVHYPKNISPEELDSMYWWLLEQLLSIRSILIRTVFNWRILKSPAIGLTSLWFNLQYRKYFKRKEMPILG
jgi:radical SAM superfamily enzyme YgiQ (UPF0313 family)